MSNCTAPNCKKPAVAQGLCPTHYGRLRRTGSIADPPALPKECQVKGCKEPVLYRGYCGPHYRAFKKHGDPLVRKRERLPEVCTVEGCGGKPVTKGLCNKHRQRLAIHGDVNYVPAGRGKREVPAA
jgi:hypothetical protein